METLNGSLNHSVEKIYLLDTIFMWVKIKLYEFKPLKFWRVVTTEVTITVITIVVTPKLSYDKLAIEILGCSCTSSYYSSHYSSYS